MNLNQGQRVLGWGILLLCLAAVPVGLWNKSNSVSADKAEKSGGEKTFSIFSKRDRIQVVKLNGMIANDEDQSSIFPDPNSPTNVRKQLHKAAADEHIKAILLRINSPGGTVGMSQELNAAVKEIRSKGKPIFVSMGDVTASGGYYISCAADKLFASPGTLTGSIGVIMHLYNLSEIEKKIGVAPETIKSGQFKDIGSMDRPMTKDEQDLLQALIMDSYDQFVTAVADGRKLDKELVKKLADGRVYSGRQALKVKLIDALGGYEDALADLKKTCKDKYGKDLYVDEGRGSMSLLNSLIASSSKSNVTKIDLLKGILPESMNPQFVHQPLWMME